MVEHRPVLTFLAHLVLIIGRRRSCSVPVWLAFVASTRAGSEFVSGIDAAPGRATGSIENYAQVLFQGQSSSGAPPIGLMLFNSL